MAIDKHQNDDNGRVQKLVRLIWNDQRICIPSGDYLLAENYFEMFPEITTNREAVIDIIYNEYLLVAETVDRAVPEEFFQRFPEHSSQLLRQIKLAAGIANFPNQQLSANTNSITNSSTFSVRSAFRNDAFYENEPGAQFASYEMKEELGRGSFAIVYRAWDPRLQRDVAIKIPRNELTDSIELRKRLSREARSVAQLYHPSIVSVIDVGENQGLPFIVSEFIDGTTMEEKLQQVLPSQTTAACWIIELANALNYAHQNEIVHRDVKPANVLIDKEGRVLLTDFGLAHLANSTGTITRQGDILGTPSYMSPEQAQGLAKIDFRTDIYSLGVILYRCLTNKLPFEGSFASLVNQIVHTPVDPKTLLDKTIPKDLATITIKCLAKDPGNRYQTAAELALDLKRYLAGEPIEARPVGSIERLIMSMRRFPRTSALAVATLVLLGFVAGGALQLGSVIRQRDRAQVAEQHAETLTANAAYDAGQLAKQQGQFQAAVERFNQCLERRFANPVRAHLMLVQCHVALGQVDRARDHLQTATLLDTEQKWLPNVAYWNCEVALVGSQSCQESLSLLDQVPTSAITDDQREFLLGMKSLNSIDAEKHFLAALEKEPRHHSARRSLLVIQLALARFDNVIREAQIAQRLYPMDDDFLLIEAMARAASGHTDKSDMLISRTQLEQTIQTDWKKFCDRISFIATQLNNEDTHEQLNLEIIDSLVQEYQNEFLPLIRQRRWHFPPAIAQQFMKIPDFSATQINHEEISTAAESMAMAHPESSLLTLAARIYLDKDPTTIADLEKSRELFQKAMKHRGYLNDAQYHARLGVFATAVQMAFVKKHDVEQNTKIFVDAVSELEPSTINKFVRLRTITIALIQAGQWELAEKWAYRWAHLENYPDKEKEWDALWHYGIVLEHQKQWIKLLAICDQMLKLDPNKEIAKHLRDGARSQLEKIIK